MNINIDGIKSQLQQGYEFVADQTGKLAHHSVRLLKQALERIRGDSRLAVATVVVANILFFEIAFLVTKIADKLFESFFGPEDNRSERTIMINSFIVVTMISSLLVGMNVALYRGLQSPLSPLVTAAVSTATCVSYILFSAWRASVNEVSAKGSA